MSYEQTQIDLSAMKTIMSCAVTDDLDKLPEYNDITVTSYADKVTITCERPIFCPVFVYQMSEMFYIRVFNWDEQNTITLIIAEHEENS